MTLTGYLALNSVFAPIRLAERERATSENNCVKTNQDIDTYCQQCKSSAGTLVSGDIKVCADVWSGSLERRR